MKILLKKVGKNSLIYLLVFIILISTYMILMTLSSLIPSSMLEENVRKSSETVYENGEKLIYDLGYKYECLFIFTDALMINTAYSIDARNPIDSFLLARKNYIPGQTKTVSHDSQYNLGANEKYKDAKENIFQTKELYGLMHGDKIEDSYEYARYWHGYLVLLRPLLVFFDYSVIRIIMAIIVFACVGTILYLLGRKINWLSSIIFAIGLLSVSIWCVTQSFNEILTFLIAFISIIVLLLRYHKIKHIGLLFFIVGSITSFVDLFTTPIITLGMLGIVYFLLLQKEQENITISTYLKKIIGIGMAWCLGYGLTWLAKWIIIELCFENRPMLSQVIEQALFRTKMSTGNGEAMTVTWKVIERNFKFLSTPTIQIVGIISIILAIILLIKNRGKIVWKENLKKCIPFVAIFCFPLVWYIVIKQHSYIHAFFAYRALILSIICILLFVSKLFEGKKVEEK